MAAARAMRLLSPLRRFSGSSSTAASLSSPDPSLLLLLSSRFPIAGKYGLLKNWGKSWIQPASPICAPQLFEFMKRKIYSQGMMNLSGRKLLSGSVLGIAIANGLLNYKSCTAYALDDDYADFGERSGYVKDELHTFWALVRKFQLPAVLVITVFLGWRHPLTLAINIALLLFCTRPNPLSVYMFIEQLRQRDMNQNSRWHKSKFFYTKNVKVEDHKFLCLATVELRDKKLNLIGILGGWWVFHTSMV